MQTIFKQLSHFFGPLEIDLLKELFEHSWWSSQTRSRAAGEARHVFVWSLSNCIK